MTGDAPPRSEPAGGGFSGSYARADVELLLRPMALVPVGLERKERLIQSGERHYSEMVSEETAPSGAYFSLFWQAFAAGADRMATEVARLALALDRELEGPVTLASLVRAGLPIGVLLRRALAALGRDVAHYGISIIRDRGIDGAAMRHVLATRPRSGLAFIDGWTGKGAIAAELRRSLVPFGVPPRLAVLADPCGQAWLAPSGDDWLIPSGILGATVSGLVSRSVLNDAIAAGGGFHGCLDLAALGEHDISRRFADDVWTRVEPLLRVERPATWNDADRRRQAGASETAVRRIADAHGVRDLNRIKPGIAEATRAVLRRMPERVFVSDPTDPELAPLVHLAEGRGVPLHVLPGGTAPYRAITLIRNVAR